MSHSGKGISRPWLPPVSDDQLRVISPSSSSIAKVTMTKAGPRVRRVASPRTSATSAAAMPPSGATRNGETSHRVARMPAV